MQGQNEGALEYHRSSAVAGEMQHLGAGKAKQECGLGKRNLKAQKQRSHLNLHGGEKGDSTQSCAGAGRKVESGIFWKMASKP